MDILTYIFFGINAIQTISDVLQKDQKINIQEQMQKLEGVVLENKLKYSPDSVDDKFNRIGLVLKSMWELMKLNTNLTDDDLKRKIMELDFADGKVDGKITKKVRKCVVCGAGISNKFKKCMICGKEYPELNNTAFL